MSPRRTVVDEPTGERIAGGRLHELYIRHADETTRLAYLLTGDATLAEDLVQEAFIRLVGRFLHVRSPAGFRAYLRKAVVNLAISHHRRQAAERRALGREARRASPEPPGSMVEERDALKTVLAQLPARQRAAVVLRYYEDLSEAATADVLGCPVGTVKSLVSRGLRTLRATMEGA